MIDFIHLMALPILAITISSLSAGTVGSIIVAKRLSFMVGAIAHAVLGGVGVAVFFQVSVMAGILCSAIIVAALIAWIRLEHQTDETTLVSALWALGMSIGLITLALTPTNTIDLEQFLFGNVLLVDPPAITLISVLSVVNVSIVLALYYPLKSICVDELFARTRGLNHRTLYSVIMLLIAFTVVAFIHVGGLVLSLAIIILPAATARYWVTRLSQMMFIATALAFFSGQAGLLMAWCFNWPPGPSVVLICGCLYFVSIFLRSKHLQ